MAINAGDLPFKVVIPTLGRAERIQSHPLLEVAHVCVDNETELAAYKAASERSGRHAYEYHIVPPYATLSQKINVLGYGLGCKRAVLHEA